MRFRLFFIHFLGTYRAMDINPGIESSNPTYLVQHELSNTLFFSAVKPPYGRELYSFTLNDALEQDRPPYTRHEHQTSLSPRNGSSGKYFKAKESVQSRIWKSTVD